MNFLNPDINNEKIPPGKGTLLLAEPFLNDPGFLRAVVLLCEHNIDGTVGFILNQPMELTLSDLGSEETSVSPLPPVPLYYGGPVEPDTLHIVHRIPDLLGGVEIAPGIYWGGSYAMLKQLLATDEYDTSAFRLFLGYSGWSVGQLEREMQEESWLVGKAIEKIVFDTGALETWKKAICSLGPEFSFLASMPINPQLN